MAVVGLTLPCQVLPAAKMGNKTIQTLSSMLKKGKLGREKNPLEHWKMLPLLPFTPAEHF